MGMPSTGVALIGEGKWSSANMGGGRMGRILPPAERLSFFVNATLRNSPTSLIAIWAHKGF